MTTIQWTLNGQQRLGHGPSRWRVASICLVLVLLCAIPSRASNSLFVVTLPVANMYSSASEDADVVSQAIFGSNVEVLEERSGWLNVRTNDQYTGWMETSATRRLESGNLYAGSGRVAQVGSLSANLYRETDVTTHRPVLTVPFETRLEVVAHDQGEDSRWLEVRL